MEPRTVTTRRYANFGSRVARALPSSPATLLTPWSLSVLRRQCTMIAMPDGMPSVDPAAPPPAPLKSHLPSLDGVRAFSILLVILAHSSGALQRFAYFNDFGTLGVCIFFVISGLLITWLMI